MHLWREMYSTSTYSSAILFLLKILICLSLSFNSLGVRREIWRTPLWSQGAKSNQEKSKSMEPFALTAFLLPLEVTGKSL